MVETVLSGRADMGLFPQRFYGQINATGDVKTLFVLNDSIEPFVQILNGCRRGFVDDHKDAMNKFQSDWVRVTRWIADRRTVTRSWRRARRRRRSRPTSSTASCS